jgi:hypothetical protein
MSPVGSCRLVRLVPLRAALSGLRAAESPSCAAEVRVVRLQIVCTKASNLG